MANTTTINWIYPANWSGEGGTGSRNRGWKKGIVQVTGISDGTAETDAVKVNLSEWRNRDGDIATRSAVYKVTGTVAGMDVTLEWDRTPDEVIALIHEHADSNEIIRDWSDIGGRTDPGDVAGGTGNIILTTSEMDVGDSYDLTIYMEFK